MKYISPASLRAKANDWQWKLWKATNDAWTDDTGDYHFLLGLDDIARHLYFWAIDTGRIEPTPDLPACRSTDAIASALFADQTEFRAEAERFIASKQTARRAELALKKEVQP